MGKFQERLNRALYLRNMKPVDLAERTGMSKPRISQYTNGVYVPKADALFKLAAALEVSPEWLRGLDVPMEPQMIPTQQQIDEWEKKFNPGGKLEKETRLADQINTAYGQRAAEFIAMFDLMDEVGQDKVMDFMTYLYNKGDRNEK